MSQFGPELEEVPLTRGPADHLARAAGACPGG